MPIQAVYRLNEAEMEQLFREVQKDLAWRRKCNQRVRVLRQQAQVPRALRQAQRHYLQAGGWLWKLGLWWFLNLPWGRRWPWGKPSQQQAITRLKALAWGWAKPSASWVRYWTH